MLGHFLVGERTKLVKSPNVNVNTFCHSFFLEGATRNVAILERRPFNVLKRSKLDKYLPRCLLLSSLSVFLHIDISTMSLFVQFQPNRQDNPQIVECQKLLTQTCKKMSSVAKAASFLPFNRSYRQSSHRGHLDSFLMKNPSNSCQQTANSSNLIR